MNNYIKCSNCPEIDSKDGLTGARIDGKYYCQGCYDEKMDKDMDETISEVFK